MKDSIYFPLIFFIGSLVCIYVGFSEKSEAGSLDAFGVTVQSLPLEGYTEEVEGGRTSGYEIRPTFISQAGTSHNCSANVEESMIFQLQENPVVNVKYLPKKPSVCEIVGEKRLNYIMLLIIGIVAFFGSLFGLYKHYRMR